MQCLVPWKLYTAGPQLKLHVCLLQPADICHFAMFKSLVRQDIDTWLASTPSRSELTRGSNRRLPTLDTYAQWIVKAWGEFSASFILESFDTCILGDIETLYISRHGDFGESFLLAWE